MKKANFLSPLARVLIAPAMIGLILSNTGCDGVEQRQQKYMEKAQEHYAADNTDKARIEVKNVLQINPKNSEARLLLAKIHKDQGEYKQAFGLYNAILEDDPQNIPARLELAKIFFAGGQDQTALEHVDVVLEQQPKDKEALLVVAGIESRRQNFPQAIDLAESILQDHPADPGAIAIIASAQVADNPQAALSTVDKGLAGNPKNLMLKKLKLQILNQMRDDAAIERVLKEIVAENPQLLDFQLQLARGYIIQKRLEEAETVLQQAIDNNPESMEAKVALIEFVARTKSVDDAETMVKGFVGQDPENFALKKLLAQFYVDNQKTELGKQVFQQVIDSKSAGSDQLQARYHLAQILLAESNRPAAEAQLNQIFAVEPNHTEALILRARLQLNDNANKDAIANLRAALKNDASSMDALKLMAAAQEREKAHQLALDTYHRILEINPLETSALLGAANINLNMNEPKRAQVLLEQLLRTESHNKTGVALLSRIYGNEQQWQKAEAVVAPLLDKEDTRAAGLILQGDLERGQQKWDKARSYYQEALKIDPRILEAVAGYTDSFLVAKDYEGAEKFLTGHISQYPELDYAHEMLGKVYQLDRKIPAAIEVYQRLIAKSPERVAPVQKLAQIYLTQKDYVQAENLLKRSLEKHPRNSDLHLLLAGIYDLHQRHQESREIYEKVLAQDPQNNLARNNYAVLLTNHFATQENLVKALELANPLAETRHPAFLDTLGWIHYKTGNFPQAISYLQAAVKQQPDIGEFRYHLGMAYFKSGDMTNAKSELELATRSDTQEYFGLEEAKKTLESI